MNFDQLFERFRETHVLIVGDVMLDTYWWGNVDRISPEAPVPVVEVRHKECRVGGAANVALNAASLGAKTGIISVIGNDTDGENLLNLMNEQLIDTSFVIRSDKRITTNKMRVMSRNQQMMRLDSEITTDIDAHLEALVISNVEAYINKYRPAVVIFEDYNKGVLTSTLIEKLVDLCNQHQIISAVDPKKKNFLAYKQVTLFKPNLKEVKEGLNMVIEEIDLKKLQHIHHVLHEVLQHEISLITLSEKGVFYQDQQKGSIIPTHVRKIADVSGAGDTVIAVVSLVMAVTKQIQLAAEMANIAGGLVCESVGTVAIEKEKLLNECKRLLENPVMNS